MQPGKTARAALVFCLLAAPAAAQQACPVHTVAGGETLRRIAERYLGSADLAGLIHARNRDRIGPDADRITPGMPLSIPCEGGIAAGAPVQTDGGGASGWTGATPGDTAPVAPVAQAAAAQPSATPAPTTATDAGAPPAPSASVAGTPASAGSASGLQPAPVAAAKSDSVDAAAVPPPAPASTPAPEEEIVQSNAGVLHVVTGGPYAPFVEPDSGDGGLIPVLVRAALDTTEGPSPRIAFVNDRDAHVIELVPRGVYTLSFPWVFPDCAAPAPGPTAIRLCEDFIASDSLYEQVTEFYALSDGPYAEVATMEGLEGARVCRPEGWPVDDLRAAGLLPDRAQLVRRPDPGDCLEALDTGAADIASLDSMLARAIAGQRNLRNPLIVLEPLSRVEGLRAIARADDPEGKAAIERLNTGLRAIAESGTWFDLVRAGILSDAS
ncbi:MAG: transporter substrate-binding domain-containing protein [Rhodobacteraceae bacterium]|nr:transporter substrate-binding domain-containing protein [Paracoccaceae bacterium]